MIEAVRFVVVHAFELYGFYLFNLMALGNKVIRFPDLSSLLREYRTWWSR